MTYDINILGDLNNPKPAFYIDGTVIEGVAKLVQRMMIILLSDRETEGIGTSVPRVIRESTTASPEVVDNVFRIALADVAEQLTYEDDTPDDERLDSYEYTVEKTDDFTFFIDINIRAVSGDSTVAKLPVDFTTKENL
jgi:hypothetical protein